MPGWAVPDRSDRLPIRGQMMLRFTKMQGLGNDFVVIDAVRQDVVLGARELRALADRKFGVGCDQILVVRPPTDPACDFRYQIFNGDGSEVEHCGNGARCFARFVHEQGLSERAELRVETVNRRLVLTRLPDGRVTVDMGVPALEPAELPMRAGRPGPFQPLVLDGETLDLTVVSMGNPHAVQRVADISSAPVGTQGPRIEGHPAFPAKVNVGYLQVLDRHAIALRVWERAEGETLACGSGACAAAASAILRDWVDSPVKVQTRGGVLEIAWGGRGTPLLMTGPAATSFSGEVDPLALSRNLP
jgi:diaminopimelate epimerase